MAARQLGPGVRLRLSKFWAGDTWRDAAARSESDAFVEMVLTRITKSMRAEKGCALAGWTWRRATALYRPGRHSR